MPYQYHYRRNLPHYQPKKAWFSVTARLHGTLPRHVQERIDQRIRSLEKTPAYRRLDDAYRLERLRETRRVLMDRALDEAREGPVWLTDRRIAALVADSIEYRRGRVYELDEWSIMPNHLHLLIMPLPPEEAGDPPGLQDILGNLKSYTGRLANRILDRRGTFWQHESFDHWIRTEAEMEKTRRYIRENPVKAKLCRQPEDWPWSSSSARRRLAKQ